MKFFSSAMRSKSKTTLFTVVVSGFAMITSFLCELSSSADESTHKDVCRGRVVDVSGMPILGARITSTAAALNANNGHYKFTTNVLTDHKGTFQANLKLGAQWLSISHPDYINETLELPEDLASLDDLRIVLHQEFRLRGSVKDFRGDPINGATVCAVSDDGSGFLPEVLTDSSGNFDFGVHDILPEMLVVTADSYSPRAIQLKTLDDAMDVSIRLLPGRKLLFRVVDSMDRPIDKVQVRSLSWIRTNGEVISQGLTLQSHTNSDGICDFTGVPSGEVTFEFFHNNYETKVETFRAGSKTLQLKLVKRSDKTSIDVNPEDNQHRLFHLLKPDGTVIRPLLKDVELSHRYGRQGTASISSDGTTIAFDAHRLGAAEDWSDSRIIVANIDGSDAKVISDGVIPALSPDGRYVAFSRARKFGVPEGADGQSIWLMNIDGSNKQMIDDNYAWGVRWTADGRTLVYRSGTDNDGNSVASNMLRTYDLATGKKRNVWEPENSPFSSLRFHFNVSRRGRFAVVAGTRQDTERPAIAVVDLDSGLSSMRFLKMRYPSVNVPIGGVMDFAPGNRWVLMCARVNGNLQPIRIPIQGEAKATSFPNLPTGITVRDPLMTPDGKHLIAAITNIH